MRFSGETIQGKISSVGSRVLFELLGEPFPFSCHATESGVFAIGEVTCLSTIPSQVVKLPGVALRRDDLPVTVSQCIVSFM